MTGSDDVKAHAVDASQDFYELLGITEGTPINEVRQAYRKTALKYHPDKVGANEASLEKFHLLQIAHEVLSDSDARALYDNARRARREKDAKRNAYDEKRRKLVEELEKGERESLKRRREDSGEHSTPDSEVRRLQEKGRQRLKEFNEARQQEWLKAQEAAHSAIPVATDPAYDIDYTDRTIFLQYPKNDDTAELSKDRIWKTFERFGPVEELILRDKKKKIDGEKHRRTFVTGLLEFKSLVSAHAAIIDFPRLKASNENDFALYDEVRWSKGEEPECIAHSDLTSATPRIFVAPGSRLYEDLVLIRHKIGLQVQQEQPPAPRGFNGVDEVASPINAKTTPAFNFNPLNQTKSAQVGREGSLRDHTDMEERRRLEDEIRAQDAAEDEEAARSQTLRR